MPSPSLGSVLAVERECVRQQGRHAAVCTWLLWQGRPGCMLMPHCSDQQRRPPAIKHAKAWRAQAPPMQAPQPRSHLRQRRPSTCPANIAVPGCSWPPSPVVMWLSPSLVLLQQATSSCTTWGTKLPGSSSASTMCPVRSGTEARRAAASSTSSSARCCS